MDGEMTSVWIFSILSIVLSGEDLNLGDFHVFAWIEGLNAGPKTDEGWMHFITPEPKWNPFKSFISFQNAESELFIFVRWMHNELDFDLVIHIRDWHTWYKDAQDLILDSARYTDRQT